jgi:hypothetical protein
MAQNSINTDTVLITPEILALIAQIDEFKGAWRALGTLAPELDLSRICAAPSARLGHLAFEGQGAFASQC